MLKMRAMIVPEPGGRFRMEERDLPEPGRHEVRIRIHACGVCHSDTVTVEGHMPGLSYPRIPGHEVIGVIDALGPDVEGWAWVRGPGWAGSAVRAVTVTIAVGATPLPAKTFTAPPVSPATAATPPVCWRSPRPWRTYRRPWTLWSPRRSSAPASPPSTPFGTAARSRAIWWQSMGSADLATSAYNSPPGWGSGPWR
jgi:Alcohol dehydrogenase GroES-like domain